MRQTIRNMVIASAQIAGWVKIGQPPKSGLLHLSTAKVIKASLNSPNQTHLPIRNYPLVDCYMTMERAGQVQYVNGHFQKLF